MRCAIGNCLSPRFVTGDYLRLALMLQSASLSQGIFQLWNLKSNTNRMLDTKTYDLVRAKLLPSLFTLGKISPDAKGTLQIEFPQEAMQRSHCLATTLGCTDVSNSHRKSVPCWFEEQSQPPKEKWNKKLHQVHILCMSYPLSRQRAHYLQHPQTNH